MSGGFELKKFRYKFVNDRTYILKRLKLINKIEALVLQAVTNHMHLYVILHQQNGKQLDCTYNNQFTLTVVSTYTVLFEKCHL